MILVSRKGSSSAYTPGKGAVFGDKLMLRRAVNNLIANAVCHTPEKGRIAVRIDDSAKSTVVLSVQNTGETIAPEHLPRLFDRFYRVHASRRRFGEGAGLGLAITRSIAHAHGGEALAHSKSGFTTFEIRLPV